MNTISDGSNPSGYKDQINSFFFFESEIQMLEIETDTLKSLWKLKSKTEPKIIAFPKLEHLLLRFSSNWDLSAHLSIPKRLRSRLTSSLPSQTQSRVFFWVLRNIISLIINKNAYMHQDCIIWSLIKINLFFMNLDHINEAQSWLNLPVSQIIA